MKKSLPLIFFLLFIISGCSPKEPLKSALQQDDFAIIAQAYQNKQSHFYVQAHGFVFKILSDDLQVPRHQRFIVRLKNDQTLLITHNIDIAPRINDLKVGDQVYFRGEYEWNDKGGVIHKTHHDPLGRFAGGWIEHNGRRYE